MGWSYLPSDLIDEISNRITQHADYIRFRAVCATWRAATAATPPHLPPQLPFLLLPNAGNGILFSIYSPTENRSYRIQLPCGAHQCHPLGSSHGWFILMGPTTSLSAYSPFAGSVVHLPPVTAVPNLFDSVTAADVARYRSCLCAGNRYGTNPAGFWKFLIRKAKLCWERESYGHCVAVAFPKSGLALWRPGYKSWAHAGRYWRFADAELFNKQLYAITRGGILSTIDISSGSFIETVVASSPPFSYNQTSSIYLVESARDLLLVIRKYGNSDRAKRQTVGFEVFKLWTDGPDGPGWTGVETLGDQILFLERGTSVSLSADGLEGCKRNCIYFTEDYDVCEEGRFTGVDSGMFCLDDGCVRQFILCLNAVKSLWPCPIWVTPNLW